MNKPPFSHLLYFVLGSLYTLGICKRVNISLLYFISYSSLLYLFNPVCFLEKEDFLFLCCCTFSEFFVSYFLYMRFFNFYILNILFSVLMLTSLICYISNVKLFKFPKNTCIVYFIIFGLLYCKCYFTLLYFLSKLQKVYTKRISTLEEEDTHLQCIIPFLYD